MPDSIHHSNATLRTLVEGLVDEGERQALCLVEDDTTIGVTYRALGEDVLRLASGLSAAGFRPQEYVLLIGPNSYDWIVVRLALATCGCVTVALDDQVNEDELEILVPESGARSVFATRHHLARLSQLPGGGSLTCYGLDEPGNNGQAVYWRALQSDRPADLPSISPDDPQMLVYTSGTTGKPKSFLLSHRNLLHNIRALLIQQIVAPQDRVLLPLPLHHVFPLTIGLLTCLASRATLVLPQGVTGPQILSALKLGRVSVVVGVPRLYQAIVDGIERRVREGPGVARLAFRALFALSLFARKQLGLRLGRWLFSSLHRRLAPDLWLLASGGARFEASLIWKLEALGWDVRSGWGLAETSSVLTNNGGGQAKKIGTEGRVLPGMELRVFEPDDRRIGELQARGPSLFKGYRNDPQANAEAFTEDGWFRTGDLGAIDEDGFVTIHGRVKEIIVLGGGKNVFPEEVEKVYAASPYIQEICVLDQDGALVGLVVPDVQAIAAGGNLQIDDVVRVALIDQGRRLAPWQRLSGYAITRETLPRTRLGKYQRFLIREIYLRARSGERTREAVELSPEDKALLSQSPAGEIFEYLQNRYHDRPVSLEASPQLDLGIDSLEWVNLGLELEQRFGVVFDQADAAELFTLRDLLLRAAERRAKPPSGAEGGPRGLIPDLTAEQRRWIEPAGLGARLFGRMLFLLNAALMYGVFRLKVLGREELPPADSGPTVYVFNHLSDLDPLVVAAALGRRRQQHCWWSGDAGRLFSGPAGRLLARSARIFPVDERAPATALAYGVAILQRGESLIWFPESWRSPDGELQRFLPGIGHLLAACSATVVPARIAGTFEALPRTRRIPRLTALQVTFATPVTAETLTGMDAVAVSEHLRACVAALPSRRDG